MNRLLVALLLLVLAGQALGHGDEEHGNHDASHGGFVMMYLDMHFELVVLPEGGVRLYYSDPMRMALPAAVVSDVAVEIERSNTNIEPVTMMISAGGDFWEGESEPVSDDETIVRVAFLFQGEPFVLDIPASVFPESEPEPSVTIADQADHTAGHHGD